MTTKNNIETEYKFLIKDKNNLILKLDGMVKDSRKKKNRQYQSNTMFDNSSGLMKTTNGRIRVRVLGETGEKVLTYKKPIDSEDGAKREIEYEIKFVDFSDNVEKILEMMEFLSSTSYERYQTKWTIGSTQISLDEYPFADFLEIEGEKEEITKIAVKLGYPVSDGLIKPVDTLFQEWRKERGLPFKPQMRFDDFDK